MKFTAYTVLDFGRVVAAVPAAVLEFESLVSRKPGTETRDSLRGPLHASTVRHETTAARPARAARAFKNKILKQNIYTLCLKKD